MKVGSVSSELAIDFVFGESTYDIYTLRFCLLFCYALIRNCEISAYRNHAYNVLLVIF